MATKKKSAQKKSAKEEAAENEKSEDKNNSKAEAKETSSENGQPKEDEDAKAEEEEAPADEGAKDEKESTDEKESKDEGEAADEEEAKSEGESAEEEASKAEEEPTKEQQQATEEEIVRASEVPDEPVRLELEFQTYPGGAYSHDDLDFSEDDLLELYRSMILQRRFEERCRQQYQKQNISGFLHLYIGQEAVSTGSVQAIRHGEDSVITAYRDHGIALAMGLEPEACMAELFGKASGVSKGKGGSMHFFDRERRFFGGHAIVGAGVPLGAGIAFAHRYREDDAICLCFLGDGAVQQGAFHEALNLAGLYDLPVVFICENNQYGMGTSIDRAAANPDLYQHAVSYGMPGAVANGMDVFTVTQAVRDHVDLAREGQPSFLELRTYRYQGHSISDPANYRAEGELEAQRQGDPIIRLQSYLLDGDLAEEDTLEEIDEEAKQTVLDAIAFAEESELPDESALYDDVYAQEDYPFLH